MKVNHEERGHAINGPSSLHRRKFCAGSRAAEEGRPDTTSPAAEEGTQAHELLEVILNGGNFKGNETQELINAVMESVRWVETYTSKGYTLQVEQQVNPEWAFGDPGCWGTADIILYTPDHLVIADFKYGRKEVFALDNLQLIAYAAGAVANVPDGHNFENITVAILQPRLFSGATVKTASYDNNEFMGKCAEIADFLRLTRDPAAPRTPEADACFYCKAKNDCTERLQGAVTDINTVLQDVSPLAPIAVPAVRVVSDLSSEVLVKILDSQAFVESIFEDVRSEAVARIRRGDNVPGYKIVEGGSMRSWSLPDEELAKHFKSMKLTKADYEDIKFKSPAKIEKLDKLSAKQKENLVGFWTKKKGAEKLVISSAPGKEIVYNSQLAFEQAETTDSAPEQSEVTFL